MMYMAVAAVCLAARYMAIGFVGPAQTLLLLPLLLLLLQLLAQP
jgi:hypothetical protein